MEFQNINEEHLQDYGVAAVTNKTPIQIEKGHGRTPEWSP